MIVIKPCADSLLSQFSYFFYVNISIIIIPLRTCLYSLTSHFLNLFPTVIYIFSGLFSGILYIFSGLFPGILYTFSNPPSVLSP